MSVVQNTGVETRKKQGQKVYARGREEGGKRGFKGGGILQYLEKNRGRTTKEGLKPVK